MRFAHQTALVAVAPIASAGVLPLLVWTHLCARLMCIIKFGSSALVEVMCLSVIAFSVFGVSRVVA